MDMGTQVSLTETFNIVTADFMSCGVPVVVSEEVEWMSPRFKVEDPAKAVQIEEKLLWMYSLNHRRVQRLSELLLRKYNNIAYGLWEKYIHDKKHHHKH